MHCGRLHRFQGRLPLTLQAVSNLIGTADTVFMSAKTTTTARIIDLTPAYPSYPPLKTSGIPDVKRWLLDNILDDI